MARGHHGKRVVTLKSMREISYIISIGTLRVVKDLMVKIESFRLTKAVLKGATFLAFALLFFSLSSGYVNAATLQLAPSSGSYNVGQTFSARVVVDSGSARVNAVEAALSFDTNVLSVVSVSKNNSVINMWTTEPAHSNSAGTITFGGGNPSPFTGQSTLITVTFRVNSEGSGRVTFNSGGVTAADGTGRDILSNMNPATFTGTSAPEPEPQPEPQPTPSPGVSVPSVPAVTSETHPEDNPWSNEYRASFNWHLPSDVTAVRLLVGRNPQASPQILYDPPIDSRELDDDIFNEDGLWYFHVQFRNSAGWGAVRHYEFGFDTEAPDEFSVEITDGQGTPTPTLLFEAEDDLSGIGGYIIRVDGMEPIDIPHDQHGENDNLYTFTEPLPEGDTEVDVIAYDNAGNETVSSLTLTVDDGGDERIVPDIPEDEDELGFFAKHGTTLFIIILLIVILGLLGYIWKLRKEIEISKKKGKQEIYEVRDEVSRVFSALRDEAEDLFAAFDGKEGLNAKEKEAFKKISDALDVSEEIVGKEIDDVEKLMQ